MVRTVRLNEPGVVYHLISRFVDRNWFIESEQERELYLHLLGRAIVMSDWRCLSYAVMSNHIHLGVVAGEEPLAHWIRRVNSTFADALNRQRDRIGSVFVRGPKDHEIPDGSVGRLIAYLHNNPVRAGVVKKAEESTWTSHRAYLGLDTRPPWLDVARGLAYFGFDRLALDAAAALEDTERKPSSLAELRRRARARGALELGTPRTADRLEVPLVARPYAHIRPAPNTVISVIAELTGVPQLVFCSRKTTSGAAQARRLVAYCAHLVGLTGSEIGAALGISHQAVSKMRSRALAAEERDLLERALQTVLSRST